ncbi:MAG: FAD-dependent monooxygenase [Planctomycetaceae bacterium]
MSNASLLSSVAEGIPWDVVVVGAGPAGSVSALGLARQGLKTLLVDRGTFPRDKVCGGCLNGSALKDLDRLGLSSLVRTLPAVQLDQFCIGAKGTHVKLAIPPGLSITRNVFDVALIQAAVDAGCEFLPGTSVHVAAVDSGVEEEWRELRCRGDDGEFTLRTRVVVLATGLAAGVLLDDRELEVEEDAHTRIGVAVTSKTFPVDYCEGTIYMAVGDAGYVGLSRTSEGGLHIAAALDVAATKKAHPSDVCKSILTDAGFATADDMMVGAWQGTIGMTRHPLRAASRGLFAVGDAAGYIEPFTGEGMSWAIRGGRAIVPFVVAAVAQWSDTIAHDWTATLAEHLASRHRWCHAIARSLRHPQVIRAALMMAKIVPALGRKIARSIHLKELE